MLTKAQIILTK